EVAVLALASFAQYLADMKQYIATISADQLADVNGGMRWEQFRPSTNVEDRRPDWAKRRDDAWFRSHSHESQTVPLPPRRPAGI
ncbi:MAG: hypothetical protein ABI175_03925, partial [Polyangiales bacterium]